VQNDHPGTDELARRLEAYATARLDPDRPSTLRMRARVMDAAARRSASLLALDEATSRPLPLRPRRSAVVRRAASLVLAAALGLVLATGITAASMAGGPLYEARLWIETATLPADGQARTEARVAQLADRLAEVQHALGAGDQDAIAAALAAYRSEIEAALAEADGDDARLARLEAALGTHIAVLEALESRVPEQARDAIGRALERSRRAVEVIEADEPDQPVESHGPPESHGPVRTDRPDRSGSPAGSHESPSGN
jgi:hypothetical protein